MTKEEALLKIEELKKYVADEDKKPSGIKILNRYTNSEIFVSTKTNIKEAVLEALEGGTNLSRADLSRANLSRANLSEANLSEANLSEADLYEANLSEANLSGADLYEANLSKANLSGADLYEANLSEAELQNAKFYGKGGTVKLKKNQVTDFLNALGFQVEE